jgi:nitrite reductase/ring-hydroxylating ferredoxin subunit
MPQVTVCRVDEVPADRALCRRLPEGQRVAVARIEGDAGFAVFENRCPHADGPLGEGRVHNNSIVCPWHFFRFDLVTGSPVGTQSIMQLRRYPVSISGSDIQIDL